MNEMSKRYMEDFIPYLKPERCDIHRTRTIEDVKRNGEIVRIVDTRSFDGKDILERSYYHENGAYGTLSAVCMGVESLPA
jgi:hypothetical protein